MKRNLKMKEEIQNEFDSDENFQKIMSRMQEEKTSTIRKNFKVILVTSFILLILIGGLFFIKEPISQMKKDSVEKEFFQIYAFVSTEENEEKKELKENIQVPLKRYNEAMSSVPGFPILFEIEGDSSKMEISIRNGKIYTWNQSTGIVTLVGEKMIIKESKTLYFQVSTNTVIDIIYRTDKSNTKKKIKVYQDNNFQYFMELTN